MLEVSDDGDFEAFIGEHPRVCVYFYAAWDKQSKALLPKVEEFSKAVEGAVFLKADVDELDETTEKYEVSEPPFFAFFCDGALTATQAGSCFDSLRTNLILELDGTFKAASDQVEPVGNVMTPQAASLPVQASSLSRVNVNQVEPRIETPKVQAPFAPSSLVAQQGISLEKAMEEKMVYVAEETTSRLRVKNLCCKKESVLIKKILADDPAIVSVTVNLIGKTAVVKHTNRVEDVVHKLNQAQLGVSVVDVGMEKEEDEQLAWFQLAFPALLLLGWLGGLVLDWWGPPIAAEIAFMCTSLVGLVPIVLKAIRPLRWGLIDINFLMAFAITVALMMREAFDATLMVLLLSIAAIFEDYCMLRVRNALKSAGAASTPKAAVMAATYATVPVEDVEIGDVLAVRAGELVAVDGTVVKGRITVDEHMMTGECMPLEKTNGNVVRGGTLCLAGYAEVRTTTTFDASTMTTISDMVEAAEQAPAQTQLVIDKFVTWFTPLLILVAVVISFVVPAILEQPVRKWLLRALVVLVSACPCALGMAAPIPSLGAIAAAAKAGVLIKSQVALEAIGRVDTLVFDKTGTLTQGQFSVVAEMSYYSPEGRDIPLQTVKHLAASLEALSTHPLAMTIVQHVLVCVADAVDASEDGAAGLAEVKQFKATEGLGVAGDIELDGRAVRVAVGNMALLEQRDRDRVTDFKSEHDGCTVLYVTVDGELQAALALQDQLRVGAKEVVSELHDRDIDTAILTGDVLSALIPVQDETGIKVVVASCLPFDKLAWVESKQSDGHVVALMGDGINDTPAITACDVGLAIGAGGSALAIRASDIVFMKNELEQLPPLLDLSHSVKRIIYQNIAVALVIKGSVIVLAILGHAPLWMGVVADVGALFFVLVNGSRTHFTYSKPQPPRGSQAEKAAEEERLLGSYSPPHVSY